VLTAAELATASRAELRSLAAAGRPFAPDDVAGHLYHGVSLGLPAWVVRLTWSKFGKAFHRDGDRVRGWNVRMVQDGLDQPWRPRRRAGHDVTFGHFAVVASPREVLLDYGRGGNGRLDPIQALRDPVVALDGPRLLLGWSDLAVGPLRVPTPSYFVLERGAPLTEVVAAPRS
jgi:hypothetical protein